jgi:hypothetical protein
MTTGAQIHVQDGPLVRCGLGRRREHASWNMPRLLLASGRGENMRHVEARACVGGGENMRALWPRARGENMRLQRRYSAQHPSNTRDNPYVHHTSLYSMHHTSRLHRREHTSLPSLHTLANIATPETPCSIHPSGAAYIPLPYAIHYNAQHPSNTRDTVHHASLYRAAYIPLEHTAYF